TIFWTPIHSKVGRSNPKYESPSLTARGGHIPDLSHCKACQPMIAVAVKNPPRPDHIAMLNQILAGLQYPRAKSARGGKIVDARRSKERAPCLFRTSLSRAITWLV